MGLPIDIVDVLVVNQAMNRIAVLSSVHGLYMIEIEDPSE